MIQIMLWKRMRVRKNETAKKMLERRRGKSVARPRTKVGNWDKEKVFQCERVEKYRIQTSIQVAKENTYAHFWRIAYSMIPRYRT